MQIMREPQELQAWALEQRAAGQIIGLVPTMGNLHAGHMSLVTQARTQAHKVVVSIFVNPTQFGANEDLDHYPRSEREDLAQCRASGVDVVYLPAASAMYAPDYSCYIDEMVLSQGLCGASRAGHFRGVCTVVAKLFNLALPHLAIFGQKDFQQAAVIKRMIRDLNFPVRLLLAPIVREANGLAMSSRNLYLDQALRAQALGLYRTLRRAQELFQSGVEQSTQILPHLAEVLTRHELRCDYIELVEADSLLPVARVTDETVLLVAAWCGSTRLIDNCLLGEPI